MTRTKSISVAATLALLASGANAQMDVIYSNWDASLTGSQQWQVDTNWDTAMFPNDPGRMDEDEMEIEPVIGANVSVGLGADLNLDVGASDVTVAALRMGGTAGPVNTTVSSSGAGKLVFENYELNFDPDPMVDGDEVCAFNCGNALLVSGGVAGSTNEITAGVLLNNESLDIGADSTNDLVISGALTYSMNGAIRSFMPEGTRITVTSPINVLADENFSINNAAGNAGVIEFTGVISGTPTPDQEMPQVINIGSDSNGAQLSTVILSGDNRVMVRMEPERANIVLAHDHAFGVEVDAEQMVVGVNSVKPGQQDNFGINLISTDDDRNIPNEMILAQWVTIKGENSLTWSGPVRQTNARGWVNMLPEGKEFTLTGPQFADGDTAPDMGSIPGADKEYTFDGSGKTVVTGPLGNHPDVMVDRSFGKQGSGAVYIQGSQTSDGEGGFNVSTYRGFTYVEGGNFHFAALEDFGQTQGIKSTGGAIGLDNGSVSGPDSAAFLGLLNNRASAPAPLEGDIQRFDDFDHGGLMLAANESDADLDFTSGALANARDMTVAAPEQGLTYTGTITPAQSTYRLGGGSGTITLPNENQLTGANGLVVENGGDILDRQGMGMVRLTNTYDYTGVTEVRAKFLATNQDSAAADGGPANPNRLHGTTLAATHLANGGAPSSIGASSSAAENLFIHGGTLRYEGAGDSTDRLMTIGTAGAAIDASGGGPVNFTNTSALAVDVPEDRSGVLNGVAFGFTPGVTPTSQLVLFDLPTTEDLLPGMQLSDDTDYFIESDDDDDETVTITAILSPTRVAFSDPIAQFNNLPGNPSTISFTGVERTLTFTGENTGSNTFSPAIADGAGEGNVVGVEKTGAGTWILDGANTYTGDTAVDAGVLTITDDFLADDGDVLIEDGAEFNLDFAATDVINSLFLAGEPQQVGTYGALGNPSAMFQTPLITGDGILSVSMFGGEPGGAGDFNGDGLVDARDYTVWRDNLGGDEAVLGGAGDDSGVVDNGDYVVWTENYGTPDEAAQGAASAPEPAAVLLGLLGAAPLALGRRRRK